MNVTHQVKNIPEGSIVGENFGPISYADTYKLISPVDKSIDQIVNELFTLPGWVTMLMCIRNIIVRHFGLQTGDGVEHKSAAYYPVGSRAMYFTVLKKQTMKSSWKRAMHTSNSGYPFSYIKTNLLYM